jgi:hypothetical protein
MVTYGTFSKKRIGALKSLLVAFSFPQGKLSSSAGRKKAVKGNHRETPADGRFPVSPDCY